MWRGDIYRIFANVSLNMLDFISPFGIDKDRERFLKSVDKRAGRGNWFWAFRVDKKLFSYELGMQMYEDAYWVYMRKNLHLIKFLIKHFDVYVTDRHDLESGLTYKKQSHPYYEHYADIAIRRCLRRYGVWFNGKELTPLVGSELDDSKVPFHLPCLINHVEKTAKVWLDSNRIIVIAKEIEDKAKLSEILIR